MCTLLLVMYHIILLSLFTKPQYKNKKYIFLAKSVGFVTAVAYIYYVLILMFLNFSYTNISLL